jgi:two-component system, chemotaxis family, chemotaxis protein CheY
VNVMRFLIVDDSPTMRRIVGNALREAGYAEFYEAENGEDALNKLRDHTVDMVITDWDMPGMNGLQLTHALRNHPNLQKIPVLMITTRGTKADVITAMQARVNDYIVKPFSAETLKEKIGVIARAGTGPGLPAKGVQV